ncbi:unnamed protein product [Victoria cruziana]
MCPPTAFRSPCPLWFPVTSPSPEQLNFKLWALALAIRPLWNSQGATIGSMARLLSCNAAKSCICQAKGLITALHSYHPQMVVLN